jgi:hypothetical protein
MPDHTLASTTSSIACEKRVKLRAGVVRVGPADPVRVEELLQRPHERAAEAAVP